MAFYVVYAKQNLAKLSVIKRPSAKEVEREGFNLASRKTWGFRRNANWYAGQLMETINLSTLGGKLFPLD